MIRTNLILAHLARSVLFLLSGTVMLPGQEQPSGFVDRLYLLGGMPTPKLNLTLPVELYVSSPADKSLALVRTVVPANEGTASIHVDLGSRLISMDSPPLNPRTVRVLHMDEVSKVDSRALAYDGLGGDSRLIELPGRRVLHTTIISAPLFERQDKGPVTSADFAPGLRRARLIGSDLSPGADLRLLELPQTDYKYVIHTGHPGSGIWAEERLDGGVDADGHSLLVWAADKQVPLDVALPQGTRLKSSSMITYHVINSEIIALTVEDNENGVRRSSPVYVYHRASDLWSEFPSSGTYSVLEGFGQWVAVTVTEDNTNTPDRISPGKGRRPAKKGGWSADDRFSMSPRYFPGKLRIYDTEHHVGYSIDTGEGDSEVLLIKGTTVYYRVNDQVFSAEATGGRIVNAMVIVKDERVRDIHWAFLGR